MKKTISINISGILFHIEEDGFATLKKYLDAINKHFSHYEDNQEIISDIENRIAEIFLSNLKNNKQVITAKDVENLIEKMGTIADFKALEDADPDQKPIDKEEENANTENDFYKYITPPGETASQGYKKITRMEKSKILGGVCAGFANYFSIDPLWTRLIAILLLFSGNLKFGSFNWMPWNANFSLSIGLFALVAYVVLWIILPVSYDDPEDKNVKKLYRNPDDRTLGGVASGLAAYFGIEVLWARLIFIALIFAGGSGLVIYLILWIITPAAKSITERIQMKGGAITLDNIESTIKENLNPIINKEESTARKILMAPFRVLGMIINGLGAALGPLGKVLLTIIRVIFGLIIFVIGLSITITPITALAVYFNFIPSADLYMFQREQIPTEWLTEILPVWLVIAASVAVLIPGLVLIILAISVWVKRNILEARMGLITFGIWILSIGVCAFQIPKVISQFKSEATHTQTEEISLDDRVLLVKTNNNHLKSTFTQQVTLQIEGKDSGKAELIQKYKARGRTRSEALSNAKSIPYTFTLKDSIMTLNRSVELNTLDKFRVQELDLILEIPYEQVFVMDKSTLPIIRNTLNKNGYKIRDVNSRNHWVFNSDGLLCLTCRSEHKKSEADSISRAKFAEAYFMKK
ncbi:PspC domain-containing protein [Belliella marina]|uniref:PspC domain-containing protein n=1 Tax=Belliella marina TaxID=1644146 RepID=A0ABW4VPI1_9BACT